MQRNFENIRIIRRRSRRITSHQINIFVLNVSYLPSILMLSGANFFRISKIISLLYLSDCKACSASFKNFIANKRIKTLRINQNQHMLFFAGWFILSKTYSVEIETKIGNFQQIIDQTIKIFTIIRTQMQNKINNWINFTNTTNTSLDTIYWQIILIIVVKFALHLQLFCLY